MNDTPVLGKELVGGEHRDAIHIALAPVIANVDLKPGEHVGFVDPKDNTLVTNKAKKFIGIIDPFYKGIIKKGKPVWLMLYQNTVTSLRHEWTHPDFQTNVVAEPESEPSSKLKVVDGESNVISLCKHIYETRDWDAAFELFKTLKDTGYSDSRVLGAFAQIESYEACAMYSICKVLGGEYAIAANYMENIAEEIGITLPRLIDGVTKYLRTGDSIHAGSNDRANEVINDWDEFWENYQLMTGKKVKTDDHPYFSCAC